MSNTSVLEDAAVRYQAASKPESDVFHLFRTIAGRLVGLNGREFYIELVSAIADYLDLDFVFICRMSHATGSATLCSNAFIADGVIQPQLKYAVRHAPCEYVLDNGASYFVSNLQQIFPECEGLVVNNVESYAGVPLKDEAGHSIGILAVEHRHSLEQAEKIISVLDTFAPLVMSEMRVQELKEHNAIYQNIMSATREFISFVDNNYIYRAVSEPYSRRFGLPQEQIVGMSVKELHGEAGFAKLKPRLDRALAGENVEFVSWVNEDKRPFCVDSFHSPFKDGSGLVQGVVVTARDITSQTMIEQKLLQVQDRYRSLYEQAPDMIATVDVKTGRIMECNTQFLNRLGYDKADVNNGLFLPDIHDQPSSQTLSDIQRDGCAGRLYELVMKTRNQSLFHASLSLASLYNEQADLWLMVWRDMSELHLLKERLSFQASHDSLTGLINRRHFEEKLSEAVSLAHQGEKEYTLFYIDLDQFKVINDSCGHTAGDLLLKQLCPLMENALGRQDILARVGGDEFAVLLESSSGQHNRQVANKLLEIISDYHFVWQEKPYRIGASIGVVNITTLTSDMAEALKNADAACYIAKEKGRNTIYVYEECGGEEVHQRRSEISIAAEVEAALDHNRFVLYKQCIQQVNGAADDGDYFEILLRMKRGDSLLEPGQFMPAAERFGLMSKIDYWVIEQTLLRLKSSQNLDQLKLCSINVSGMSLGSDSFQEFLIERIQNSGIPCEKLCFEITETVAISNLHCAIQLINTLREMGCRFALDDFGSGLSSFGYLKQLPVDLIKIDGSFVKDIVDDPVDHSIVKTINDIAHITGKQTVAEFVSNEQIYEKIIELGVDYGQGYHFGRAEPL